MVPPLFVVKWYKKDEEYKPVKQVFKKERPNVKLVCQKVKVPVRRSMLFELIGYFRDKRKKDCSLHFKTHHRVKNVELDMLLLVLKFVRNGEIELQQNEYVRFAKAVHVLRPRPTFRLEDKNVDEILVMYLKESKYKRHIQNLHPRNGDSLVECDGTFTYIHPIVASLYSGELNKKVQAAKTARERVIINDLTEWTYDAIRDLIYGRQVEMDSMDLFPFCKFLEKYDVKYIGVASAAPDLPPSNIEPSPGPSRLSVEKLEDVPESHTEQARIPESQVESGDSTSGTGPASTHSETEIA